MGYYLDEGEARRFLRVDDNTDINVQVGLSNGSRLPRLSKGEIILLKSKDSEEPVDLLAIVRYPVNDREFIAMALEFINREHLVDGRARHDSLQGARRINYSTNRILVGADSAIELSRDIITNPYVFALLNRKYPFTESTT